ncbi:MAG: ATP-binding cassette domain-containing protein [Acidimicrobiales bacterium]
MDSSPLTVSASLRRDDFELALDLRLEPGETLGLTGDIGTGKTSALWLIAGRLRASQGRVALGDAVWDEPSTATFVADRPVSLLSQAYQNDLPERSTGTEAVIANIESSLNPDPDSGADRDPEAIARTVLAELGVGDHVVDRLPWTFSGAEAQRVALARAVAPRPAVVLLDEPFGALDKRTGTEVRQWLAQWLAGYSGIAVVASTRADDLEQLTDRVISLDC